MRRKILFKVNHNVVAEESLDLTIGEVDDYKWMLMKVLNVQYDDIDVEFVLIDKELSDIDVSPLGMIDFKSLYFTPITGIECIVDDDTLLDAINSKDINKQANCFKLI